MSTFQGVFFCKYWIGYENQGYPNTGHSDLIILTSSDPQLCYLYRCIDEYISLQVSKLDNISENCRLVSELVRFLRTRLRFFWFDQHCRNPKIPKLKWCHLSNLKAPGQRWSRLSVTSFHGRLGKCCCASKTNCDPWIWDEADKRSWWKLMASEWSLKGLSTQLNSIVNGTMVPGMLGTKAPL